MRERKKKYLGPLVVVVCMNSFKDAAFMGRGLWTALHCMELERDGFILLHA